MSKQICPECNEWLVPAVYELNKVASVVQGSVGFREPEDSNRFDLPTYTQRYRCVNNHNYAAKSRTPIEPELTPTRIVTGKPTDP